MLIPKISGSSAVCVGDNITLTVPGGTVGAAPTAWSSLNTGVATVDNGGK